MLRDKDALLETIELNKVSGYVMKFKTEEGNRSGSAYRTWI